MLLTELQKCSKCSVFHDEQWTDKMLKDKYGRAMNVPCDRLGTSGEADPPPPPSPASTLQRADSSKARPCLSERALSSNTGPDTLGFAAGPANDVKMDQEMTRPKPKKSEAAAKRGALETLVGGNVNISRGGTSTSATNKLRASTGRVVAGAANAISPNNEEVALDAMEAGIHKRRAEINAVKAKAAAVEKAKARRRF